MEGVFSRGPVRFAVIQHVLHLECSCKVIAYISPGISEQHWQCRSELRQIVLIQRDLVGDSASQIFTSSGAGILSSMICAKIAADELVSMNKQDFMNMDLSPYEKKWKKDLYKIFSNSYNFYKLYMGVEDFSEYGFSLLIKLGSKIISNIYR